jgi:hypothetical protein
MNSLACIDHHVKIKREQNGLLLIGDFLPDFPQKRKYHHLPNEEVFTYKQDYAAAFTATNTYTELVRCVFDHDHPLESFDLPDSNSRAVCVLLKKSFDVYPQF